MTTASERDKTPLAYKKVDTRYSASRDFLITQLREADSVHDFRTVKQAVIRSSQFNVGSRAFQFARVAVEANERK